MLETPKVLLKNLQDCKIHFIGIGGIGISGLAKYLKAQGATISGSDIAISPSVKYLKALGVEINIPHDPKAINNQDAIIHSAIIKEDNTEIQRAKELEIPILSRKDALYSILKDKRVFSVCGAHGKSSITAMLSAIFPFFGAIIGAHSKEFDSNVRESANDSLVFEADESDSSFLFSNPYAAIVPNTEPEHLEHYGHDLERFFFAYEYFLDHAQKRVIYKEDPFLKNYSKDAIVLEKKDIRNIQYILKDGEPYTSFELKDLGAFLVWGLGEHNATNASLAILSALDELDLEEIRNNLLNFKGIKKRFDILQKNALILIDDYAHHPTEISATLKSTRIYANLLNTQEKIVVIWQAHKYSRLMDNLEEFKKCFLEHCDRLIILPVYSASEVKRDIDLKAHFKHYNPTFIDRVRKKGDFLELLVNDDVVETIKKGFVIGFGAGDITYQLRGEM